MTAQCDRCTHWQNVPVKGEDSEFGRCRRYPPAAPSPLTMADVYNSVRGTTGVQLLYDKTAWPITKANEQCGEFSDNVKYGPF